MKWILRVALAAITFAGVPGPNYAAAPKDPATYTINVHVSAAEYNPANALFQNITATIDGKHFVLSGGTSSAKVYAHGNGLLNPGDYHAKLKDDIHKSAFESIQSYEFLLPDGTTRVFGVIAQSE